MLLWLRLRKAERMAENIAEAMAGLKARDNRQYASRSEAAHALLRTAVMEGLLTPGSRLREVDVGPGTARSGEAE